MADGQRRRLRFFPRPFLPSLDLTVVSLPILVLFAERVLLKTSSHILGRHFLQIPGPTNVPDRVLRAMDFPTIDHRGPEFQQLGKKVLADAKKLFRTESPVVIYPSSGTGGWEAALVNTLSPGDQVLMYETGHFANLWKKLAERLGLDTRLIESNWRHGANASEIEEHLRQDSGHAIKAVCIVHNETSTGVTSDVAAVRRAIDAAKHPALFFVDAVSSIGALDYRHDEWGVDVAVAGSQKGLMMPPGLAFNAISTKALAASRLAKLPRSYWHWQEILESNVNGFWPYTPATNLLYGFSEACDMLFEEGLEKVFARHQRHAKAARAAVSTWGLEMLCQNPSEYSAAVTAVIMPKNAHGESLNADHLRAKILERFNMSLGQGLSKVSGQVFRIGHLGDFNDLSLMGTLAGIEMGLELAGVPFTRGGVGAAMACLIQ